MCIGQYGTELYYLNYIYKNTWEQKWFNCLLSIFGLFWIIGKLMELIASNVVFGFDWIFSFEGQAFKWPVMLI